ncbi:hypothetical protein SAMN04488556_2370 [Halostagnicola kamekurae]|uniref:Uncharacterized protein n=1 Tax=Halostagnicola kamekurae TaxID=619731 RepID=A0A1I6S1I9_9EURY|nr:hypothetical protein SAMN04488556_2370 [Halostagnicola kamekurae]
MDGKTVGSLGSGGDPSESVNTSQAGHGACPTQTVNGMCDHIVVVGG